MMAHQRPWLLFRDAALCVLAITSLTAQIVARGSEPDSNTRAAREHFFEQNVRPMLAENCYSCHGEKKQKGGLRLDSLEAILKGGDSGPALVAGKPTESLIVEAINYAGLEMPPKGKLTAEKIAVLTRWVALGAPWPGGDRAARAECASNKINRGRPLSVVASTCAPAGHSRAGRSGRQGLGRLVSQPDRRVHPCRTDRAWADARSGSGQGDLDPAYHLRPDGAAADRPGNRRVHGRSFHPERTSDWSTDCWPRRATASAGDGTGSTWCATPSPTAIARMPSAHTPGAIATMSSGPSIATNRTTAS